MDNANSDNLWHYNKRLKTFANQNRKSMTKAEACIWKFILGGRKLKGYQFRRQRPILNYIADFMCKELMLIIEVDGITHQWEHVAEKDTIRENELKQIGFSVIRFDDDEVLNDIANVERTLLFFIEEFEARDTNHPL
ncbi:endonuclease domain-containing protein [Pedobacter sp. UC225_61]|uniref:endonuclease domain-containing protein n=1 Tax=Pedobacter sp. UC225_61 TaxID=3374623 RepID=UPI0037A442F6